MAQVMQVESSFETRRWRLCSILNPNLRVIKTSLDAGKDSLNSTFTAALIFWDMPDLLRIPDICRAMSNLYSEFLLQAGHFLLKLWGSQQTMHDHICSSRCKTTQHPKTNSLRRSCRRTLSVCGTQACWVLHLLTLLAERLNSLSFVWMMFTHLVPKSERNIACCDYLSPRPLSQPETWLLSPNRDTRWPSEELTGAKTLSSYL